MVNSIAENSNDAYNRLLNKFANIRINNVKFSHILVEVLDAVDDKFTKNHVGDVLSVTLSHIMFNYDIPQQNRESKHTEEFFDVFSKFIGEFKKILRPHGIQVEYDTDPDGSCTIYKIIR